MLRDIEKLSQGEYDLVVIGGGINGAAIAHKAAARRWRVALLEKNDFASGTSSKSTKLIHGGIRYLENFEFDLVRESLKERSIQFQSVPHLVKPMPFVVPVYKGDKRPLWMMSFGVWLYDFLAGRYKIGEHKRLSKEEIMSLEPAIDHQNLVGGVMYFDAQMDDARLCLENVLSAAQKGAQVANYVEVKEFIKENGRAVGIKAIDRLAQKSFQIKAKKFVCTVGPWTNEVLKNDHPSAPPKIRLTKGVHIVYEGELTQHALLLTTKKDSRVFFIIPWMGNSLIGTTDTDYRESPDQVVAEESDIEYLLTETQRVFPGISLSLDKVITTFAGLRPLVVGEGSPSNLSRKHLIFENYSGVAFVIGGKYTTYRKIAEDCVAKIAAGLAPRKRDMASPASETSYPLYGSGSIEENAESLAEQYGLPVTSVEYLMDIYGTRYKDILTLTLNRPDFKKTICTCSPAIAAQIVYSIEVEMARTSDDILTRRLGLTYVGCKKGDCQKAVESFLATI